MVDKGKEAEHLADHLEPVDGAPLHFSVRGNTSQKFMPYWQISEEEFTCYPEVTTNGVIQSGRTAVDRQSARPLEQNKFEVSGSNFGNMQVPVKPNS
jgi:hypothetical protein